MSKFQEIADSFLKTPDLSGLPPRVRDAIRRREWANEILLRAIQLIIISIFCFIYTISPKTSPEGIFTPAPYVLATYFVLSVIGLIWGMLREPPDWSIYISIMFDFCLLYGLMISFHIQYDQPASFILKAPALLYVFIFIAIRALRFNPKYVITAGTVAIVGWAAVIYYVTRIDPGDNMLTRSYVEYLTANRILIGAEIDKILSIAFVTIILAVSVNGSSNLLATAIAEQSAADNLSRFFDTSIAKDIRSDRLMLGAGEGERRKVTIFNVDIRGFSQLSVQLEPSRVMSLLTAYRARINPIIQANGGVIDKFMGDGIMAIYGTNPQEEDNQIEVAAIRTAEQLLADFENWPKDNPDLADFEYLRIGIGIATGEVSWGAIGIGDRLEMTVIGPAVNLSAKLEKQNKALGSNCLCDRVTWDAAIEQGYEGQLAGKNVTTNVEGVNDPVDLAILTMGETAGEPIPMNKIQEIKTV